jgi:hypothetical protein
MCIVPIPPAVRSAAAVLFGRYGDVTRQAQDRRVSRQTLYRETDAVVEAVDGSATRRRIAELEERLRQQLARLEEAERQAAGTVRIDADKQAKFASTAQAEGVSLSVTRRLLGVLLGRVTPSVAKLGRLSRRDAERAGPLLRVLDRHTRPLVRQATADEMFAGRRPVIMLVEPASLCWVSGQLEAHRDGPTWARHFGRLRALEQVTRDGGTGMQKGLEQINAKRLQRGKPTIADQADHFHVLRECTRALCRLRGAASRALEQAERADKARAQCARRGQNQAGQATAASRAWQQAEAAFDRWSAGERAWGRLREGIGLFAPDGALNTRARAEAVVAEVLPQLQGPEWAKARRALTRPELCTFLDRAHAALRALPAEPGVRQAALRCEAVRRQPALVQGATPQAAAMRAAVVAAGLVLALGGEQAQQTARAVRGVLRQAWRASSLVEGLNSVLRMHQARHRRLSQELLDLKRLYWNCRALRTGPRKGQTPYQRLGLKLPPRSWWELLRLTPEQLEQELSAQGVTP